MKHKIKDLSKEKLQDIILEMAELLSKEQYIKLEAIVEACMTDKVEPEKIQPMVRMSQEFVDGKMKLYESWMKEIDEGDLYLDVDEYEDYSSGYWDSEWITDYYDNQGIGDKLATIIQFAKDCVDDRWYQEANYIYEWLWEMSVNTDSEYECDPVDLELLAEKDIIRTDMEQLALLTLYADYQTQVPGKRVEDIYLYFAYNTFRKLHIEDMFRVGRENLEGEEQFWKDWIALLKTKTGEAEGRLLKEAVLYHDGVEGLAKTADENCSVHPSLYLSVMEEYIKKHDYVQMEKIGESALEKITVSLVIRSEIALKAAYASTCLMHADNVMRFCWESFRSDSNDRNFLRLFGTEEMAKQYGMRGREVFRSKLKGNPEANTRNPELRQNIIGDTMYHILSFYIGDFERVKEASKNPKGSLGWSSSFIRYGIRLFLLYLYEESLPSKAAASIAGYIGFQDTKDMNFALPFENEVIEESRKNHTSAFWNYFQRWKPFFKMSQEDRQKYLFWAEKIVYSRADAIVGGQHRGHYGEVAVLLSMVAEIKASMGCPNASNEIFQEYRKKFPRHSSFQAEMRSYFEV